MDRRPQTSAHDSFSAHLMLLSGFTLAEKSGHQREHLANCGIGEPACKLCLSNPPVKVTNLVGQNNTLNSETRGDRHFKWITLDLACDRADQRQPNLAVVRRRGENKGRTPSGLLVPGLGTKRQPDKITTPRDVATRHYHTSWPTDGPVLTSAWIFCFVT